MIANDSRFFANITSSGVRERRRTELRIVRALIRHLKRAGWAVLKVNDGGDEPVKVRTEAEALDAIFAVDDSRLYFAPVRAGAHRHSVLLIGGNGEDIVSDWSFSDGDPDGFNAAMDSFLDYLNQRGY